MLLVGAEGVDLLHETGKQGIGRAVAVAAEGVDETLLAELLAALVEGLRDPVGVEGQEVVGLETGLPDRTLPLPKEPQDRRRRLQPVEGPVTSEEERAEVTAVHVAERARQVVVVREEEAREGAFGRVLAEEAVDGLEEAPRLVEGERDLAAQVRLEVRHEEGGRYPLSHHVPDHEAQAVRAEGQEVVVVAAHRLRGMTHARVVEGPEGGPGLREEAGLDLPCDCELVNGAALGFELFGERRGAPPPRRA